MPIWGIWSIFLATFVLFGILHALSKNKKPFVRAFGSMLCGLLTLIAVNISGIFTGVSLPISLLSVITAVIGGIPGVTLMLALNMFI